MSEWDKHVDKSGRLSRMGLPLDFEPAPDECGPIGAGDRVMLARHGRQHSAVIRWIADDCETACFRLEVSGEFIITETKHITMVVRE